MFILGAQPNVPSQLSGFKTVATVTRDCAHCRGTTDLATVLKQEQDPATVG